MAKFYRAESTQHDTRRIDRKRSAKAGKIARDIARNNAKSQQLLFCAMSK